MRTYSFADSSGALRVLARPVEWAALKMPATGLFFALADAAWAIHRLRRKVEKLDRLFWQKLPMARLGPDIHFATSREIEEPFRVARCLVLHLEPFRTGVVVGWFDKGLEDPEDENAVSEALRRAVSLRNPTRQELDAFDDSIPHGTGKPGGLRYGATGGSPVRGGGPGPRMVITGDAGADE